MGEICSKRQQAKSYSVVEETEIVFPQYKSALDADCSKLENKYNFLQYFQLYEYLLILTNLPVKNSTSTITKSCLQEVGRVEFQVFIENKVMKNFLVNSMLNDREELSLIFKDYMLELFDILLAGCKNLYRKRHPGVKKVKIDTIRKLYVMTIGILLCNSCNRSKVDFLYNLFLDEAGQFKRSEEFEDFLFFLLFVPSTATLNILTILSKKYPEQMQLSGEEFIKHDDAFEVDDLYRIRDIFLEGFFRGKDKLTKEEFIDRFIGNPADKNNEDSFGWMFSSSGIRQYLVSHNDVKAEAEEKEKQ